MKSHFELINGGGVNSCILDSCVMPNWLIKCYFFRVTLTKCKTCFLNTQKNSQIKV
jgi:hypothetical protein